MFIFTVIVCYLEMSFDSVTGQVRGILPVASAVDLTNNLLEDPVFSTETQNLVDNLPFVNVSSRAPTQKIGVSLAELYDL